jgi:hypothetical protein
MNYFYESVQKTVSAGIDKLIDYVSDININSWILFTVYGFSKIAINLGNYMQERLSKYKMATVIATQSYIGFIKIIQYVYVFMYNQRIEPRELNWSNLSLIDSIATDTIKVDSILTNSLYKYNEVYTFLDKQNINLQKEVSKRQETNQEFIDSTELLNINKANIFNSIYLETNTKHFIQDSTHDSKSTNLLTIKMENQYLYRIISNRKPSENKLCDLTPSKTRFLSISYTHPKLDYAIYIDIGPSQCVCGNEILSACFVLRCLEYQTLAYEFDLNYTLNIIDNRINQFALDSNQYMVLTEDRYTICKID